METQALDDPADGDVAAHRDRAREMLTEISRQANEALTDEGIDLPLFFLVPSVNAIVTFGCSGEPDDQLWSRVAEIVSAIIGGTLGLAGTRCKAVACATTTESIVDQPSQSPAQPSEPSPWRSAPMSTPILPHSGVDLR